MDSVNNDNDCRLDGKMQNPITVDNCQRKWEMRSQQPHWNDEMIAK